jgi:hypothetical protein
MLLYTYLFEKHQASKYKLQVKFKKRMLPYEGGPLWMLDPVNPFNFELPFTCDYNSKQSKLIS